MNDSPAGTDNTEWDEKTPGISPSASQRKRSVPSLRTLGAPRESGQPDGARRTERGSFSEVKQGFPCLAMGLIHGQRRRSYRRGSHGRNEEREERDVRRTRATHAGARVVERARDGRDRGLDGVGHRQEGTVGDASLRAVRRAALRLPNR
jgi:hypothetical protein